MVMETFPDGSVKIRRRGETTHAHSLAAVDKVKINSALKKIEKEELAKGYTPQAVWSALTFHKDGEGQKILEEAGGRHLDSAHVYNQSLLLRKGLKKGAEDDPNQTSQQQQQQQQFVQDLDAELESSQHQHAHGLHDHGLHDHGVIGIPQVPMMMGEQLGDYKGDYKGD